MAGMAAMAAINAPGRILNNSQKNKNTRDEINDKNQLATTGLSDANAAEGNKQAFQSQKLGDMDTGLTQAGTAFSGYKNTQLSDTNTLQTQQLADKQTDLGQENKTVSALGNDYANHPGAVTENFSGAPQQGYKKGGQVRRGYAFGDVVQGGPQYLQPQAPGAQAQHMNSAAAPNQQGFSGAGHPYNSSGMTPYRGTSPYSTSYGSSGGSGGGGGGEGGSSDSSQQHSAVTSEANPNVTVNNEPSGKGSSNSQIVEMAGEAGLAGGIGYLGGKMQSRGAGGGGGAGGGEGGAGGGEGGAGGAEKTVIGNDGETYIDHGGGTYKNIETGEVRRLSLRQRFTAALPFQHPNIAKATVLRKGTSGEGTGATSVNPTTTKKVVAPEEEAKKVVAPEEEAKKVVAPEEEAEKVVAPEEEAEKVVAPEEEAEKVARKRAASLSSLREESPRQRSFSQLGRNSVGTGSRARSNVDEKENSEFGSYQKAQSNNEDASKLDSKAGSGKKDLEKNLFGMPNSDMQDGGLELMSMNKRGKFTANTNISDASSDKAFVGKSEDVVKDAAEVGAKEGGLIGYKEGGEVRSLKDVWNFKEKYERMPFARQKAHEEKHTFTPSELKSQFGKSSDDIKLPFRPGFQR